MTDLEKIKVVATVIKNRFGKVYKYNLLSNGIKYLFYEKKDLEIDITDLKILCNSLSVTLIKNYPQKFLEITITTDNDYRMYAENKKYVLTKKIIRLYLDFLGIRVKVSRSQKNLVITKIDNIDELLSDINNIIAFLGYKVIIYSTYATYYELNFIKLKNEE